MPARAYRLIRGMFFLLFAVAMVIATENQPATAADARWPEAVDGSITDSGVEQAGFRARRRPCPPGWVETVPAETPVQPTPAERPVAPAPTEAAIPPTDLASAFGAAEGPATATPNMIGDTLNGGFGGMRFFGEGALSPEITAEGASVGISGGDRRFKIAEDENPLPADRVFFNFNHFQNPILDIDGTKHNLERFTFGIEKTFRDGLWSVGFRVPFSGGYNATQSIGPGASLFGTEFGDMSLVLKRALIQRDRFALSAGLSMVFPTGPDWKIVDDTGTLVQFRNESMHLGPFVGAILSPTDRLFFLCFGQLDFDTQGNTVLMRNDTGTPGTLRAVDVFNDQTLGFLDFTVGYRLYQNPSACFLTGIIPMVELHYTSSLSDMDFVQGPLGDIGATANGGAGRRDILNMTGGVQLQLGALSSLTVAGVLPLKTGLNREFDSEFIVQFDRRY